MSPSPVSQKVAPPRAFRLIELGAVVFCIGLNVLLLIELVRGFAHGTPSAPMIAGLVFAGYLAADFLTGLVHFIGDSFGTVETPVLGRTFVLPFRSHHDHPAEICEHDFVETNGNNAFATLFVLVPTVLYVPVREGGGAFGFGLFVLVTSVLLMLTNQIHKWAHVAEPPRVVRQLQRAGILLSPESHRSHHAPPYGRGYCVTSGIFNRLLDPVGFFPFLERVIRAVLFLPRRTS